MEVTTEIVKKRVKMDTSNLIQGQLEANMASRTIRMYSSCHQESSQVGIRSYYIVVYKEPNPLTNTKEKRRPNSVPNSK